MAPLRVRPPVSCTLRGPARATLLALASALAACSLGAGARTPAAAPPSIPAPPPALEAAEGAVVEARLAPAEKHVFPLDLAEGTYVEVHVDRPERELGIDLFDPGVDPLAEESQSYVSGERATGHPGQMVWEVTRKAGEHHLRVEAVDEPVVYRLEVTDLRPATDRDWSRHLGMRMYEQGQALRAQRPEDALEKFLEARELFVKGEYERGIGATYTWEGRIKIPLGRRDEAREAFHEAAEHWRLGGDIVSEITSYSRIADLERDAGEWESAQKHLELAEARAREEENGEALARVYYNFCRQYRDQQFMDRALEACRESLRVREELGLEDELDSSLLALGHLHADWGDLDIARDYYLRALEVLERYPNPDREASLRNSLAILYQASGNYLEALVYYQDALKHYESHGIITQAARILFNMGTAHAWLGDLEKTLEHYSEALRRMEQSDDRIGRIQVLRGIGWAQRRMGDLEQAQRTLDRALELSRGAENTFLLAYALQQRGELDLDLGMPEAALEALQKARNIYEATEDRRQLAAVLQNIADAYAALDRDDDALATLREAIEIHKATRHRSELAACYYRIARLEKERGNLEAAHRAVAEAIELAEQVRGVAGTEDIQALFSATVEPYHDLKIDLLIEEHLRDPSGGHDARALHESERSKAQTLREIIVEADLELDSEVPERLQRERVELRAEIETHERRRQLLLAGDSPDPDRLFRVRLDLESTLTRLQEVERQIREASPRYAALTDPDPVSAEEIQSSLLDSETALLEYNLGEERSILWLVTRSAMRTYLLPGRSILDRKARCLHRLVKAYGDTPSPEHMGEGLETCLEAGLDAYRSIGADANPVRTRGRRRQEIEFAYHRTAAELSEALLGDVTRDGPLPLRLAVVSDGALEYVPFAALPLPAGAAGTEAEPTLLIDRHEIVRLPSASVLAVQREQRLGSDAPPPGLVAIVADPVYNPDDPRVTAEPADAPLSGPVLVDDYRFPESLPFPRRLDLSSAEAQAIAELVPDDRALLIEGFDATPNRILGGELGDYLYVHFATHGEIDTEYPKLSSLVLSQVDTTGRRVEDGNLRLQDIYGLELDDVDMVVLSACETALGKEVRGEGLMGLTRGFLYAGAERVAASLWRVQDVMTTELMTSFYRGLFEEDRAPADALRQAQLAVRDADEGAHSFPYYWAGFVLQGEWR